MTTQEYQNQILQFANELAEESGAVLRTAYGQPPKITFKGDASPVTETDCRIETVLRERIADRYPEHGILGEEFGAHNLGAEFVWVLDPIDGTMPFILGLPVFGTLIGVAKNGKPWAGIADFPVTSDRWSGISGQFATHNGTPVATRTTADLSTAILTNSSPDFFTKKERETFRVICKQVHGTQYGGSCMSYCALASGRSDLAVDGGLDAYDLFATTAIIEGAGGIVTDWLGKGISLDWRGQVLASGNDALHAAALEVIRGSKSC